MSTFGAYGLLAALHAASKQRMHDHSEEEKSDQSIPVREETPQTPKRKLGAYHQIMRNHMEIKQTLNTP